MKNNKITKNKKTRQKYTKIFKKFKITKRKHMSFNRFWFLFKFILKNKNIRKIYHVKEKKNYWAYIIVDYLNYYLKRLKTSNFTFIKKKLKFIKKKQRKKNKLKKHTLFWIIKTKNKRKLKKYKKNSRIAIVTNKKYKNIETNPMRKYQQVQLRSFYKKIQWFKQKYKLRKTLKYKIKKAKKKIYRICKLKKKYISHRILANIKLLNKNIKLKHKNSKKQNYQYKKIQLQNLKHFTNRYITHKNFTSSQHNQNKLNNFVEWIQNLKKQKYNKNQKIAIKIMRKKILKQIYPKNKSYTKKIGKKLMLTNRKLKSLQLAFFRDEWKFTPLLNLLQKKNRNLLAFSKRFMIKTKQHKIIYRCFRRLNVIAKVTPYFAKQPVILQKQIKPIKRLEQIKKYNLKYTKKQMVNKWKTDDYIFSTLFKQFDHSIFYSKYKNPGSANNKILNNTKNNLLFTKKHLNKYEYKNRKIKRWAKYKIKWKIKKHTKQNIKFLKTKKNIKKIHKQYITIGYSLTKEKLFGIKKTWKYKYTKINKKKLLNTKKTKKKTLYTTIKIWKKIKKYKWKNFWKYKKNKIKIAKNLFNLLLINKKAIYRNKLANVKQITKQITIRKTIKNKKTKKLRKFKNLTIRKIFKKYYKQKNFRKWLPLIKKLRVEKKRFYTAIVKTTNTNLLKKHTNNIQFLIAKILRKKQKKINFNIIHNLKSKKIPKKFKKHKRKKILKSVMQKIKNIQKIRLKNIVRYLNTNSKILKKQIKTKKKNIKTNKKKKFKLKKLKTFKKRNARKYKKIEWLKKQIRTLKNKKNITRAVIKKKSNKKMIKNTLKQKIFLKKYFSFKMKVCLFKQKNKKSTKYITNKPKQKIHIKRFKMRKNLLENQNLYTKKFNKKIKINFNFIYSIKAKKEFKLKNKWYINKNQTLKTYFQLLNKYLNKAKNTTNQTYFWHAFQIYKTLKQKKQKKKITIKFLYQKQKNLKNYRQYKLFKMQIFIEKTKQQKRKLVLQWFKILKYSKIIPMFTINTYTTIKTVLLRIVKKKKKQFFIKNWYILKKIINLYAKIKANSNFKKEIFKKYNKILTKNKNTKIKRVKIKCISNKEKLSYKSKALKKLKVQKNNDVQTIKVKRPREINKLYIKSQNLSAFKTKKMEKFGILNQPKRQFSTEPKYSKKNKVQKAQTNKPQINKKKVKTHGLSKNKKEKTKKPIKTTKTNELKQPVLSVKKKRIIKERQKKQRFIKWEQTYKEKKITKIFNKWKYTKIKKTNIMFKKSKKQKAFENKRNFYIYTHRKSNGYKLRLKQPKHFVINKKFKKLYNTYPIENNQKFQKKQLKTKRIKYKRLLNPKNRRYKLIWERKKQTLNKNIYTKKKSFIKKYINYIFYAKYKKRQFNVNTNIKKSFIRFTKFYKLIKKKISKKIKKNRQIFFVLQKRSKKFNKHLRKPNVQQFIFQRRQNKEGFKFWQNYSTKWVYYNLLKNKTVKFYFSSIRIKTQINRKNWKYLNPFKRFQIKHPRVGQWSTIGLVGNYMARNTLFIKRKIFFYIFSNFYNIKNKNQLKKINKKFIKIYSKFNNQLTTILKLFEQRLDIILFRANLVLHIDFARILITRGYINVNFIIKKNIAFNLQINDFIAMTQNIRNIINEISEERYESFRKIYLNRFYKNPYVNTLSNYISTILNSLTQMIGKKLWIKLYAKIQNFLHEYKLWNITLPFSNLQNLRLYTDSKHNKKNKKIKQEKHKINWKWLRNENKFINTRLNKIKLHFELKKYSTLKNIYRKQIMQLKITNLIKIKQKNIKKTKKKTNLYIFGLITKDLLTQTWENFPKNLLINIPYRYVTIIQNFELNFQKFVNAENKGRLNIKQINWLIKNH